MEKVKIENGVDTIITDYANNLIALIELISNNSYQVALKVVNEELIESAKWEIPFIQGRVIQWDINIASLENNICFKKDEYKHICPHDFLDEVTASMNIQFNDDSLAAIIRILIIERIVFYYKLSTRDFSKHKKTIDLFQIVTKNELHPNFKNLLHPRYESVRNVLESWTEGFEDRDNKFVIQFQETFNSMFWELYLYQCLKVLKMDIDFSKQSPDFIVKSPYGNKFCIEAVITNGTQGDKHHYENDEKRPLDEIINFSAIRILNSIDNKYKHFIKKYSNENHVKNKPFIIAIASFEQSDFFIQNNQAINLVLYGQKIKTTINNQTDIVNELVNIDKINKNKNTQLDVGLFTSDKYKEISAIIFTTTATISKAISRSNADCVIQANTFHLEKGRLSKEIHNELYFESLLDGLQIHRNPFAENPLDSKEFSNYEISKYTYNKENNIVEVYQNNNTLLSRISKFPYDIQEKED